jgi:hypothetical protein
VSRDKRREKGEGRREKGELPDHARKRTALPFSLLPSPFSLLPSQ